MNQPLPTIDVHDLPGVLDRLARRFEALHQGGTTQYPPLGVAILLRRLVRQVRQNGSPAIECECVSENPGQG